MKQTLRFTSVLILILLFATSCKKEKYPLPPPIANAGDIQTIQLDINTVTVTGSGTSKNGPIVGYLWSLISGPNTPGITSPSSATTTVTGLIAGDYKLQFAVIDDAGLTGVDTVSIIVIPAVQKTITLQPSNSLTEGHVDSYNVTGGGGDTELEIGAWTINGTSTKWRSYLKFDQSQIPSNATIISATLYLYAMPNPHAADVSNAMNGAANDMYVQRITGSWAASALNYNNLPTTVSTNRVSVAQTASSFENATINVTSLVQDMQSNVNYGFELRLQNESIYNFRAYASSFYSDASLHPKLVITYK